MNWGPTETQTGYVPSTSIINPGHLHLPTPTASHTGFPVSSSIQMWLHTWTAIVYVIRVMTLVKGQWGAGGDIKHAT